MLKLSERAYPKWVQRTDITRRDLRLHWAGEQAFAPTEASQRNRSVPVDPCQTMRNTPARHRARAAVLTMARYRCAHCRGLAIEAVERPGALVGTTAVAELVPVCEQCHCGDAPLADAVADVMARFAPVAKPA